MTEQIHHQEQFRPELFEIYGCKDYREQRQILERMDDIMVESGMEQRFIRLSIENLESNGEKVPTRDGRVNPNWINHCICALRVTVARHLEGESLREMSVKLSDSHLMRWFCRVGEDFGLIKAPSKSSIDRYEKWLPVSELNQIIDELSREAGEEKEQPNFDLEQAVDLSEAWLDGTCLKANIHYPVDWVLLRDVTRTLMKATLLIRKRGLKNRMPQSPEDFLRDMNRRVIAMSQSRRRKGGKKRRKKILRNMCRLEKKIAGHAQRHRDELEKRWDETDLSQNQAEQIISRIDGILEQIPAAIKQARERIIGERRVTSKEKVLSLYEENINVVVRGKADAEVEFGNVLRLAESREGLVISWRMYEEVVADNNGQAFEQNVKQLQEASQGKVKKLWCDRGMDSAANVRCLEQAGIFNGICPKAPARLREKMQDQQYAAGQKRRASTEARIGIFKNKFADCALRVKGYENRERAVGWSVLAHNLWVLARLPHLVKEESNQQSGEPPGQEAA